MISLAPLLQKIPAIDLLPGQSERIVFDERLPGFGLRLRADGKRTWVVQYRAARKQRRVTIRFG
jgi:hypothetical protein